MKTLPYLRIGICGGIAAGKSTVLAILESVGFRTIDADKVAHSVYKPGTRGFDVVIARFGDEIRSAESGEIDRRKLGAIVFKDAAALRELENLIYPLIRAEIEDILDRTRQDAAIEAVNLFSSGLNERCDETWAVQVPPEIAVYRLTTHRGMSEIEARNRVESQRELAARSLAAADWVIDGTMQPETIKDEIRMRTERLRVKKLKR